MAALCTHEGSEGPPTSCAKLWRYRAHRPNRIGAQLAFCTTHCVWRLQIPDNLTCLQQVTKHAWQDLKLELCKSTSPQAPRGPQARHLLTGGHPVPRWFASASFHVAISTTESSSVLTGECKVTSGSYAPEYCSPAQQSASTCMITHPILDQLLYLQSIFLQECLGYPQAPF